ncbi:MAG: peptidoglycan DD-metalloendopeptidase family protein [Piscirickettsiaceae bacterium]|nr:peptidoglycan DD-metalloendopeptidase family protein [Piscirickettsiaceae bacterium]
MKVALILFILSWTLCSAQFVAPVGTYNNQENKNFKVAIIPLSSYRVKRGDTLFSISLRHGYDHKILATINGIEFPYTIYVNEDIWFRSIEKVTRATKLVGKEMITSLNKKLVWCWPTLGKILSTYSKDAAGRKGINISGRSGQSVIASSSGKVLYSGNGLTHYGNIIIIKHNDVYSSTYAHNKIILVKEGQQVEVGQKIALLGRTGIQKNRLYFEIRRNGRPVDPILFLPENK